MATFISELKRRNVFRVALLYVFSAWLILQVADVVIGVAGMPDWTLQFIALLLALGLPLALFFSWAYELTPEGLKRESETDPATRSAEPARRLDRLIIVVLLLAVGVLLGERFLGERSVSDTSSPARETAEDRGPPPVSTETGQARTIAVLPFDNMSSDPEQEFFSDGITEEILNVLTRESEFPVVSRTSSFSVKGANLDAGSIAERLNARYLVEGSVRKAGNQLRITAQLIDADTDTHLWSNTFDRELVDVFAIQEEIARAISGALHEELGSTRPTGRIDVEPSTDNLEAYQLFLRGRHLLQRVDPGTVRNAVDLLEQAVALDAEFAEAWANLALAASHVGEGRGENYGEWAARAEDAANRALKLDPDQPLARSVLGNLEFNAFRWEEAIDQLEAVLRAHPREPEALHRMGEVHATLGYLDRAIEYFRRAERADPAAPFHQAWLQHLAVHTGDKAMQAIYVEKTRSADFVYWPFFAYEYERHQGNWEEAERYLAQGLGSQYDDPSQLASVWIAAQQDPALAQDAIDAMRRFKAENPRFQAQDYLTELGTFAEPEVAERAFDLAAGYFEDLLEDGNNARFLFSLAWLWQPTSRPAINHPSIQKFFFEIGIVAYWNEHGWPDQCEPLDADRFVCQEEVSP